MAIQLVQEWPVSGNAAAEDHKSADGVATTPGNTIMVRISTRDLEAAIDHITVTDNGGNTYTQIERVQYGALFYCPNANAASTVTAHYWDAADAPVATVPSFVLVTEFSGIDQATPLLDSAQYASPDDTDVTAPVTPEPGALVFGMLVSAVSNRTYTLQGATYSQLVEYRAQQMDLAGAWAIATDTTDMGPEWERTAGGVAGSWALTGAFKAGDGTGPGPLSVDAGADQSIYVGQTANVSATASGGTAPYSYAWTVVSGNGSFLNSNQAATTFTPTGGAGVRVLRCIVTDANSTVAQDDLTLTVTQAPSMVGVAEVNDATGWTATGGTVKDVLNDTSDSTLITSMDNPVDQILDVTVEPVTIQEGQHFVTRVRARRGTSTTTATVTGYLYTGTTLHSTVTARTIPGTLGDVDLTFPADEIENITAQQWTDGVRVVATVTATS